MKNGMLALCAALISAGIAADAQEWLGKSGGGKS